MVKYPTLAQITSFGFERMREVLHYHGGKQLLIYSSVLGVSSIEVRLIFAVVRNKRPKLLSRFVEVAHTHTQKKIIIMISHQTDNKTLRG